MASSLASSSERNVRGQIGQNVPFIICSDLRSIRILGYFASLPNIPSRGEARTELGGTLAGAALSACPFEGAIRGESTEQRE